MPTPARYRPRVFRRAALSALAVGAAAILATGCPSTDTASVSGSFVGRVTGSDLLIAAVTDGDQVLVYVTDGDQTAKWYDGTLDGASATLESAAGDSEITVTLDDGGGSGQIVLSDGQTADFEVEAADPDAGLYIATETVEDAQYLGGWVVLNDGDGAGVVMQETQIIESTPLDPETLESETAETGKLQAAKFAPVSSGFGGGFNLGGGSNTGGGFNFGGTGFQTGGGFNFGGTGFQFGGFQFGGFQFGGGGFNFGGGGFNFGT
ncbi:MAG: hypothetical protein AMXMBFR47_40920 [Planctomycetota bacterium]